MPTYSWQSDNSGDWNTGSFWAGGTVPASGADVIIDVQNPGSAYTVTIGLGKSEVVNTLTLNAPGDGTNDSTYLGAYFEMDGTLTFDNPSTAISIDGSRQTILYTDGGTFINAGTVAPYIQGSGNVLFTGTNGFYVENELVSVGTITVDTSSIAELINNTLTDGVYGTNGDGTIIDLGGTLEGMTPTIQAMEGPPADATGWTELTFDGVGSEINQWNGSAYVSVATTLSHIMGGGTVDVKGGAVYSGGANTLTIDHTGGSNGAGMLNVQGGTVDVAEIDLNNGILQGNGTVAASVVNNGTVSADGGTLNLTGSVTGTGTIVFDQDFQQGTVATGSTLAVGSVGAGQTVVMNGNDTLLLTSPTQFAGTIEASTGDAIILQGQTATSAVATDGTLVVSDGSIVVASLLLAGSALEDVFSVSGSTITVGTTIASLGISGTEAGQSVAEGSSLTPFAHVTVSDPNVGQTETLTVTLSSASGGTLSTLGGGSYDAATGVYTDVGTAAAVTADLDALVFTPASTIASGVTLTTGFTISVTDSLHASATDTTTSVSTVGTVTPTPTPTPTPTHVPNDFVGNGTSDILFENANSGLVLYWQMQNGTYQQDVPLAGATSDWQIVGTGDFAGNGTSDILFHNSNSGLMLDWQIQNGAFSQSVPLATANLDWTPVGTGDFTGNGTDDILFQNDSGQMLYWQMQNGAVANAVPLIGASFDWKFLGTGDFTGNGTDDILFQNTNSGLLLYWQMQNGTFAQNMPLTVANPDWQYVGVGDFTGSGTDDILFQNTNSGAVLDWQMSNGAVSQSNMIGTAPTGYNVVGVGNYGGGSTSDILLANASGSYIEWQMSNGAISQTVQVGGATSDWKLA